MYLRPERKGNPLLRWSLIVAIIVAAAGLYLIKQRPELVGQMII